MATLTLKDAVEFFTMHGSGNAGQVTFQEVQDFMKKKGIKRRARKADMALINEVKGLFRGIQVGKRSATPSVMEQLKPFLRGTHVGKRSGQKPESLDSILSHPESDASVDSILSLPVSGVNEPDLRQSPVPFEPAVQPDPAAFRLKAINQDLDNINQFLPPPVTDRTAALQAPTAVQPTAVQPAAQQAPDRQNVFMRALLGGLVGGVTNDPFALLKAEELAPKPEVVKPNKLELELDDRLAINLGSAGTDIRKQVAFINRDIRTRENMGLDAAEERGMLENLLSGQVTPEQFAQEITPITQAVRERLKITPRRTADERLARSIFGEEVFDNAPAPEKIKMLNQVRNEESQVTFDSEGNPITATGAAAVKALERQQPTKTTLNRIQDRIINNDLTLRRAKHLIGTFQPEFLTFKGKIRAKWFELKDKFGADLTDDEKEFLKRHTVFRKSLGNFFVQFVKSISGAQVSAQEMDRLQAAIVNDADSPTQFQSAIDEFIFEGERMDRVLNQMLIEGFEKRAGESKEEFEKRFGAEFDDRWGNTTRGTLGISDPKERAKQLRKQGLIDTEIFERLRQEGRDPGI